MKYEKWMLLVLFFILWILGITTDTTFGGWIHILPIAGVVAGLVFLLQGRSEEK